MKDPLIDEIRAIRRELAEKFGNDLHKLCEHLRQVEQEHKERLLVTAQKPERQTA